MLFLGSGDDAEAQLVRNIRILSARFPSSTDTPKGNNLLGSFLRDLCFWGSLQVQTKKDQHTVLTTRDISFCYSVSTAGSSGGSNKSMNNKSMKRGDSRRSRSRRDFSQAPASKAIWKTATDPVTGRTYYYDAISRKTQWDKPPEIQAMEKRKRTERRQKDLAFFKVMELNILASLERGELISGIPLTETKKEGPPIEPSPLPVHRVRTISSMDQVLLAELRDDKNVVRQQHQSRAVQYYSQTSQISSSSSTIDKSGRPPLPIAPKYRNSLYKTLESLDASMVPDKTLACSNNEKAHVSLQQENSESDLAGIHLLDAPIQTECDLLEIENISQPLGHTRRNTGGTIYLENTMEKPDIKATIKCVCGVFRAHILQSAENRGNHSPTSVVVLDIFRDDYDQPRKRKDPQVPSLNELLAFYEDFFRRSQMESDTIIMSLIYVERLIKASNGALAPMPENWRSILFSCMVLASKVWDDLSMWNVDFSNVSVNTAGLTHFTLHRINDLEIALLKCLNFDVKVPASEYAKYYFLIRTMLLRSGLVKEVEQPLGKEDAYFRTLEARTDDFQDEKLVQVGRDRRSKSLDFIRCTDESQKPDPMLKYAVCL